MYARSLSINVHDSQIDDLMQRLRNTRFPACLDAQQWDDGASLAFVRRLTDYWQSRFDWRAQEARLNELPNFQATIDGCEIHFVHQKGKGPEPMPLVLTHGWPGSFVEMERVLPLLTDPASYGGNSADAFHVVVPSLPASAFLQLCGLPEAAPTASPGCGSNS